MLSTLRCLERVVDLVEIKYLNAGLATFQIVNVSCGGATEEVRLFQRETTSRRFLSLSSTINLCLECTFKGQRFISEACDSETAKGFVREITRLSDGEEAPTISAVFDGLGNLIFSLYARLSLKMIKA